MPYSPKVELYLNGKIFNWWESITTSMSLNGISDTTINVPNNQGQFSTRFPNDSDISILSAWDANLLQLRWKGKIEKYKIIAGKTSSVIEYWGRDKLKIFDDERTVDDNFNPYTTFMGTYGDLIKYLNNKVSKPLKLSYVAAGTDLNIVKTFEFEKTVTEITDAAKKGGYEWFYDGITDSFVIRPPIPLNKNNAVRTFVLGSLLDYVNSDLKNVALLTGNEVEVDSTDKITRVRFDGDGVSTVYPPNQVKTIREFYQKSEEWKILSDVNQACLNYYNSNRFDRVSLKINLPFGESLVRLGDIVICDDSKYGLSTIVNKLYRVISMSHTWEKTGGWNTDIGLGDFTPKLFDFI